MSSTQSIAKPMGQQGFLYRLANTSQEQIDTYIQNLRYRAKRARMNANFDCLAYMFKDLIASR